MTTNVIEHTESSYSDMSDEQLVQQIVQGDSQAFNLLYNRYVKLVYNRVRYTTPVTDVEDVTQEIFIAMLDSLPSFRADAKFSTWLFTLTKNKVAENYRKRSRKKETMQVDLEHADLEYVGHGSDRSKTSVLENRITVQHALNNIPRPYREVLLLRFVDDMKFNEIANHMNKNLEATKSLYRRALSALTEELENKNEQIKKE
jgi:RNA polymerase sigma-70 factor (ECF subfamily)